MSQYRCHYCCDLLDSPPSGKCRCWSKNFVFFPWEIFRWWEESVFMFCWNFYWVDLSQARLWKFIKGILTHHVHGVICMQTLYANGTNWSRVEFVPDFSPYGSARRSCPFRAEGRTKITKFEVDTFQYVSPCNGGFIILPVRILVSRAYPAISLPGEIKIESESITCDVACIICERVSRDKIYWPKQRFVSPFRTEGNFARHSRLSLLW